VHFPTDACVIETQHNAPDFVFLSSEIDQMSGFNHILRREESLAPSWGNGLILTWHSLLPAYLAIGITFGSNSKRTNGTPGHQEIRISLHRFF
jgi:hypothetical protein